MSAVPWERYPLVDAHPRAHEWLQIQAHLGLAPKTIIAYGQALEDFLQSSVGCPFPFDPNKATNIRAAPT